MIIINKINNNDNDCSNKCIINQKAYKIQQTTQTFHFESYTKVTLNRDNKVSYLVRLKFQMIIYPEKF